MESRVQKTLLNARVNLIFYFLTLCLSFFSRKIFLDCLGADFVGLTGTLQNLLGFLNLAELGIGGAIGYLLYKPLFDQDHDKINEIISVMGYLYRWIGGIILGAGCVLACFLPLIFPETGFDLALIYFAYFAFLSSSMIGYFINYRQNLLGADQRNYVVTGYYQTMNICKTVIQLALAYYTRNYYLWVLIELSFGIIYSFVLNWKINRTYPWLKADVALGRRVFKKYPEVMVKTRQLFVHKLVPFTQYQCTSFLVYAFVSLETVAFYGNYMIITDKLTQFTNNFYNSMGASVGNLIAEQNYTKIERIYWELLSVRFLVAGWLSYCIYYLSQPFIVVWLGPDYLLSDTVVVLIVINFFVRLTREVSDPFLFGAGLFQDVFSPVVEMLVFFPVAIIGGYFIGLPGIILGGIVSLMVIGWGWKPYFLYTRLFKTSLRKNVFTLLKYFLSIVAAIMISAIICEFYTFINPYSSFYELLIYAMLIGSTCLIVGVIIMYTFTRGFRDFVNIRFLKRC
jgi:O-antigen/teichoic acid export membrane protein